MHFLSARIRRSQKAEKLEKEKIKLDAELASFDQPIYLSGDGYTITEKGLKNTKITFVPERQRLQSGYSVAMCAYDKLANGETLSDAELVPIYLRPSQAERERNERLGIQ